MNRRATGAIPCGRTLTRHVTDLGPSAKHEYFQLREKYKAEDLSPREAMERAAIELQVEEKWKDWKQRKHFQQVSGSAVPVTPGELKAAVPSYTPLGEIKAEEIGDKEMSLAEQVAWAKKWSARLQNGEEAPTKFPSEGALFWLQSAISNRREFEKVVLRVESPGADGADAYLQDGQHQYKEIENQIQEAVRECGDKLVELESGFGELLKETVA